MSSLTHADEDIESDIDNKNKLKQHIDALNAQNISITQILTKISKYDIDNQ